MGRTIRNHSCKRARRDVSASTSATPPNGSGPRAGSSDAGGSETEREGFEPSVEFYPYTRLAGVHLRPLGHLSGAEARHVPCCTLPANGGGGVYRYNSVYGVS